MNHLEARDVLTWVTELTAWVAVNDACHPFTFRNRQTKQIGTVQFHPHGSQEKGWVKVVVDGKTYYEGDVEGLEV
jgi:hypothetical protein